MSADPHRILKGAMTDQAILSEFRKWGTNGHSDHLLLLYAIAGYMDRPSILEIGVEYGRSTQVLLAAADFRDGKVESCDVDPETYNILPPEILNHPRWTFHRCDSRDLAQSWTDPIDLLFIDGDHSLEGFRADFDGFSKFVTPHGYVVMHDALPDYCSGVSTLIDEIEAAGGWNTALFRVGVGTCVLTRK